MAYTTCLRCKTLLPLGQSYCPDHMPKPRAKTNAKPKASATQRGYNYEWQKNSKAAIREQPWCSYCGSVNDLTGDHIKPKSLGGTNDKSNIMVLCRSCNSKKKNRTKGTISVRRTRTHKTYGQ